MTYLNEIQLNIKTALIADRWLKYFPERWFGRERQLQKVQQDNRTVQVIYRRAFEQMFIKRHKGLLDGMPADKSFLDLLPNNSEKNDRFCMIIWPLLKL